MFAAQGVGNCAQGISRQAANPVARYLQIPVCESISLLKFICNPKIGIHNTSAVICRHVQSGKKCRRSKLRSNQSSALPSALKQHAVNECPI